MPTPAPDHADDTSICTATEDSFTGTSEDNVTGTPAPVAFSDLASVMVEITVERARNLRIMDAGVLLHWYRNTRPSFCLF
jgi:hypothetical protein